MREYCTARYIRVKRTSRMVAQMKFRARDFHRTLSLSLSPRSFPPFFASFFYFAPSTEHVRGSGEHFRSARPGRRSAGEYLSERKTNSLYPALRLFLPRAEGGTRGWQCGLFAEKSHSVGSEPQLRASHCLRGVGPESRMLRGEKKEIEYVGGKGEQKAAPSTHAPNFGKHLADSRRSFSPFSRTLDNAGKSSPSRVMKMFLPPRPPLPFSLIGRIGERLHPRAKCT